MTDVVPTSIRFLGLTFGRPEQSGWEWCESHGVEGFAEYRMTSDVGGPDEHSWVVRQPFWRKPSTTLQIPAGDRSWPRHVWQWDGNRETPTLKPSFLYCCKEWRVHLFLTAGRIEPCGDQTARVLTEPQST